MIENLGKPINPKKCDHRTFLVKGGKIKEISFNEAQELNHAAFEDRKPYPNLVQVSDKVICFNAGDYCFNFVRADLMEILAATNGNNESERRGALTGTKDVVTGDVLKPASPSPKTQTEGKTQ